MSYLTAARVALADEEGMTLIELLIAAAIGIVVVGAAGAVLISAVQQQPEMSKRSQQVTDARVVLERMTRELRNGVTVYESSPSAVAFETRVRRTSCGGSAASASQSSILCRVKYSCTTTGCSRTETAPEVSTGGTPESLVEGLSSSQVFSYTPPEDPTYVGVTLEIPDPDGTGSLTISDGASLRTLTLAE
jgi:Tfp pilus assembly protein PilW